MKKTLKLWSLAAICMTLLGSCHGQSDDVLEVQLVPSTTTIVADGEQEVSFQVLYGISDVTAQAEIYSTEDPTFTLDGATFSTEQAGEYIFRAKYNDLLSKEVKITAIEDASAVESRFERHICVMDLTGTWCSFCPGGMTKLNMFIQKKEWKDIVHLLALHDNTQGDDPMGLALTSEMMKNYGNYGFPMFVTDLRDSGSLTNNVADIVPSFNCSIEDYPAHSDVKLATTLSAEEVSVSATLFAESAGEYGLSVWLVEDGIIAPQKDGSLIHEDFEHNHVARAVLSASWRGDSLGMLAAEQEVTKQYTTTLNAEWKSENMYVMALALDSEGYVNNVAVCSLGESVDYKYITTE